MERCRTKTLEEPQEFLVELEPPKKLGLQGPMASLEEDQRAAKTKKCSRCHVNKDVKLFYKNRLSNDGLQTYCRPCQHFVIDSWRRDNLNKERNTKRVWNKNNIVKRKQYRRRWYVKNSVRHKKNVDVYKRNRRLVDINFRIRCDLSRLIRERLRVNGNKKFSRADTLLGCSVAQFKQYIECQFLPGMSWDNHGPVWHIDHIKPCASFDLSKPAQQLQCFNHKNCRPLWAKDNIIKSSWWKNKLYKATR